MKRRLKNENMEMELNSRVQRHNLKGSTSKKIDDLPPEMLEAVLKHFTTEELLNSRQVNREWNELSTRILRHREDNVLRFRFGKGQYMQTIKFYKCRLMGCIRKLLYQTTSKNLTDFLYCLKDSKYFPCSHFDFGDVEDFGSEDIKNFLAIYGKNILFLKITVTKSVEILSKLLLEHVPNLKKLEIQFIDYRDLSSGLPKEVSSYIEKFHLPNLEVLVVNGCYRKFRGLVENVLTAACNLKKFVSHLKKNNVEANVHNSITAEDLNMLQSLNKLNCLTKLEICLSEDLITYLETHLKSMDLKVKSLNLSFGSIWENQKLKLIATSVTNQLLESCKDVIEELGIEPFGLLSGVVFPKLEKLRKLELWPDHIGYLNYSSTKSTMFTPEIEMAYVFPNLKELDMHLAATDDYFPPSKPFAPMPSIEVLRIFTAIDVSPKTKEKLMTMTPNVTTLFLSEEGDEKDAFIDGFRVILNNLPRLSSFGWMIANIAHQDLLFSLDAAISGVPEKCCKHLSKKFRDKDRMSANELAAVVPLRKHSSILDLKDLRKLDIHFCFQSYVYDMKNLEKNKYGIFYSDSESNDSNCESCEFEDDSEKKDEGGYTRKSKFFQTGFTKVSQFLAFQLMPNLKIRIETVYD